MRVPAFSQDSCLSSGASRVSSFLSNAWNSCTGVMRICVERRVWVGSTVNGKEGQILSWKPEAIGGRSGSSIIDYTDEGPRVVGLLTWAGGGEGLGQSTPFLLSAMRGKLPATLKGLPAGAREVSCQIDDSQEIVQVPSTISRCKAGRVEHRDSLCAPVRSAGCASSDPKCQNATWQFGT